MSINNPKVPPNSNESEQSVLGGILINNDKWDEILTIVSANDFYYNKNQIIFNAIDFLLRHNEAADINTVLVQLEKNNQSEIVGGLQYLLIIADNTPSIDNIVSYANHVRELSVYRQLLSTSSYIADLAYLPENRKVSQILDEAETKIFEVGENYSKNNKPYASSKEILPSVVKEIEKRSESHGVYGLETGFIELDRITHGLQRSDLIVIAGRPSMGKTSFAMNIAENVAIKNGIPVLIFSLEMPKEQILMRMISSYNKIAMNKIRDGKMDANDWHNFNQAVATIQNADIIIDDSPSPTPNEVRATARRVKREYADLGLIVIDYIGLMRVSGAKDRNSEISEISRSLKALAKDLDIPVLALSQLNRNVDTRPLANKGKMPYMSDLRDSGSIEQDSDIIAFVYRDEHAHKDANKATPPDEIGKADIKIAKHRNGETGIFKLGFDGKFTKFTNLDHRGISEDEEQKINQNYEDHMENIIDNFNYSESIDPNELNENDNSSF